MSGQDHTVSLEHTGGEGRTLAALSLALAAGQSFADIEIDLTDPEQCRFGAYTLVERIGAGGMGLVYRAHQLSLERDVAVKILNMRIAEDGEALARFRFEAKSAAALNHPNIVSILEIGQIDRVAFIAMQLVRGETLADRIQREKLATAATVALMLKLCDAVGYAHRLQLLHLDLKPANVLLNERGEPLVADFGLARHMNSQGQVEAQEVSGTPGYMAPEQVLIKEFRLSVGTDIYALGAILYELLCGQPPHGRGSAADVMQRALAGQIPSPRSVVSSVPKDLEAICLKCLSLRAADRYAGVEAFAEDLRRFANGLPVSVRSPTRLERLQRWYAREPRFALALVALLSLAMVGGLVMTHLYRQSEFERAGAEGLVRLLMAQSSDDERPILETQRLQSKSSGAWIPLIDCHEVNVNCGQGLSPFTNIDPKLPIEQRQRYLESLRAYVPRIKQWGNTRLSVQLAQKLGELASGMYTTQRARASAATDTADGFLFAYLLAQDIATRQQDKDDIRSWFRHALAKADQPWQVQALAQSCNAPDPDCIAAIQHFRSIDPDNAAAWLLGVPKQPGATGDAQLMRAANAPDINNHQTEFLDAALAFANHVMPTMAQEMRVAPSAFALDAWGRTGTFGYPYDYCKRSFTERDAPMVWDACRAVFDKIAKSSNPMLLDENFSAVMAMHMSADPAIQASNWQRVRNARWIYTAWAQLPPASDPDAFVARQFMDIRAHGELANLRSVVAAAHLPLEAPEEFVTRKPLPWSRHADVSKDGSK